MFNATFLVKNRQHYLALFNTVVNIDNGETLFLGGGSKIDSNLVTWYLQDGQGTLDLESNSESDSSSSTNREYKVTVYDFKGRKQGGYRETLPAHENIIEEDKKLPTAEEYRAYFEDQDFSDANLTAKSNSDNCITRIKPKQGSSVNVPKAETNSIFSGCPSSTESSEDGRIVKLMVMNRGGVNTITTLINVKTRKEIKFSGVDLKNEGTLIIVKPDLIIGYNKFDGRVIGFKPASQSGAATALVRRCGRSSYRPHPSQTSGNPHSTITHPLLAVYLKNVWRHTDVIWHMNLTELFNDVFPEDIRSRYFLHETCNATTTLRTTNPELFDGLTIVLNKLGIVSNDLLQAGGQESGLARRFNKELRSRGWREAQVDTEIELELCIIPYKSASETRETVTSAPVSNKGYKVDDFKGRIVLDLEWSAKNGSLDRDISIYRALYDAGFIDVGVIVI